MAGRLRPTFGTLSIWPNADWNGTVELTYDVTDGTDSTSATASFDVLEINDAPSLDGFDSTIDLGSIEEDLGYTGDEGDIYDLGTEELGLEPLVITEAQLLENFSDVDNDSDELSVVNLIADSGSLTETDSGWEFIPSEDFVGDVNFSFSVTDGDSFTPAQAKLSVTSVNDDIYVDEGDLEVRQLSDVQEDGSLIMSADQLLDVIEADDDWDSDQLEISNLAVAAQNEDGSNPGSIETDESGDFVFTPAENWNGTVSFSYTVTDPAQSSVEVVRTIRVLAVNDAPQLSEALTTDVPVLMQNHQEDVGFSFYRGDLLRGFSDAESELSELEINNLAVSSGSISGDAANGWTYTPEADFNGEVTLSYAVTDPDGASTIAAYTFNVESINDAPERVGDQLTLGGTPEDTEFTITESQLLAGYLDRDGDELSVTTLTLADDSIGTLEGDAESGWTFSPNADWNGPVELNYVISDGQGESNSEVSVSNTFQVFAVNDAPINTTPAATPVAGAAEDNDVAFTAGQLLAGFSDAESDLSELTIAGISANNGTLTDDGEGNYTFSPDADFNGEVTLNYVVADPDGGNTLASTTFTIESVNDGPEFKGSEPITLANIQEDTELVFTASQLLNGYVDRDGDTLTVENLTVATTDAGELTGDAESGWTFTPNADWNGTVELTYDVTDGTDSTSATASFDVLAINDAPFSVAGSTVEIDYQYFDGSYYTIVEGPTWEEAQANAEDLGGNLVSISSDEETQFLVDSFKDINLAGTNNLPIDEDIYWIGLTKESGTWEWSDGSELNYQQWGPLEPYENNGADDRGGGNLFSRQDGNGFSMGLMIQPVTGIIPPAKSTFAMALPRSLVKMPLNLGRQLILQFPLAASRKTSVTPAMKVTFTTLEQKSLVLSLW